MVPRTRVLRVLDANINRAREGLRVCEELVRFCVGTASGFRRLRALRHALDRSIRHLPVKPTEWLGFRNSQHDPGRTSSLSSVRSVEHLLLINLQRTKEALRVLEESSRLIAPGCAQEFQRLRFRTYDVERDLLIRMAALRHHRQRRC